jgi:hypothetical protein
VEAKTGSVEIGFLTFLGAMSIAFLFSFAIPRAREMQGVDRRLAEYGWYLVGLLPTVIVCFGWVAMLQHSMSIQRPLLGVIGAVVGAIVFVGIGELIHPSAAQAPPQSTTTQAPPPVVNQAPGSAFSYGQQGGITAGTINVAPGRLAFSEQLGNELVTKMPQKKTVNIRSVGGNSDQSVANEIQTFLQQRGYTVNRTVIGMLSPPPDRPITLMEGPDSYTLTIAPSAR